MQIPPFPKFGQLSPKTKEKVPTILLNIQGVTIKSSNINKLSYLIYIIVFA